MYVCICACVCVYVVCVCVSHNVDPHMMWLRSVGSIKFQVSFAEYRLFYRALLQKRPKI